VPTHKLLIVGKHGKSYDDYRQLVSKLGLESSVIFTGYVPVNDLPLFYNGASLFAYPSFYEGFGLPPLEAMACATPHAAFRINVKILLNLYFYKKKAFLYGLTCNII
jgi:glycosyltransferase involved in cell wall biosynthesis